MLDLFDVRSYVLFLLVFSPLEWIRPIRRGQPVLRPGWLTDTAHFFVSRLLILAGMAAVMWASTAFGRAVVPEPVRVWIAGCPLWLQVPAITVVADLGFYLSHRLMHTSSWLWPFHAVHHSSERLDWLAAYRVHPVDQVLVKGASLAPVFALHFSVAAVAVAGVIYQWQALAIHANLRAGLGPLRWLVATSEFHHWHHADDHEARDRNFAGQLPLWDVVFGTAHLPHGRMPARYGVADPVPARYLTQLVYPFRRLMSRGLPLAQAPAPALAAWARSRWQESDDRRHATSPTRRTDCPAAGSRTEGGNGAAEPVG